MRRNLKKAKAPPSYLALAAGQVKPEGWLLDWARASAAGIAGDLYMRHVVFEKGWTGEDFQSKGEMGRGLRWPLEQSAYWLDGLVRLAYILEGDNLKKLAHQRLDTVVDGTTSNGQTLIWWEPADVLRVEGENLPFDKFTRNFNNWSHAHMGRALVAYYRITGNPKILEALTTAYSNYPIPPLAKDAFVPHGAATNLDPMLETYALSGDERVLEAALGYANSDEFRQLTQEWSTEDLPPGHTVLYYEHARVPAITSVLTGDEQALRASRRVLELGLTQHGLPVGLASGQEHLMGIGAVRGLETCTAAASGWTNKWMLQITGEGKYADQVEQGTLNAGAAAVTRDFDQVCYFQSMNRIDGVVPVHEIKAIEGFDYSPTAGKTLCCVANATRMIPDYIQHMWLATMDGGLAAGVYGPCRVETVVADGTSITIHSKTDYPFNETVELTVTPQNTVKFPLHIRIPGWCTNPSIHVNNTPVEQSADSTNYVKLQREWKPGDKVRLHFPMTVQVSLGKTTPVPDVEYFKKPVRAVPITKVKKFGQPFATVHYGPLVFALPMEEENPNRAKEGAQWNYALAAPEIETTSSRVEIVRNPMPAEFRWQLDAPLKLKLPAVRFDWKPSNTQPLPDDPVAGGQKESITLVPYGTTRFRVSMFPLSSQ
jgi:uncharacterized protein